MNDHQKAYYQEMRLRDRLIPFEVDGAIKGFLTFYIGNGDIQRFIEADPWNVLEDNPTGDKCYIAQLITDHAYGNQKYSHRVMRSFIDFLKGEFPNIKEIIWRRWRNGKVFVHKKHINGGVK